MVAILNWDSLHDDLKDLLRFTHLPIQVAETWASRDDSISSGVGGLWLALNHQSAVRIKDDAWESNSSIFSASISNEVNGARLTHVGVELDARPPYLGDIFEGECGALWTAQVLSRQHRFVPVEYELGAIVRPGLGHGETVRNCYSILNGEIEASRVVEVLQQETYLAKAGWCNGLIGVAAAAGLIFATFEKSSQLRELALNLAYEAIDRFHDYESEYDSGLCHGASGIFVVAVGIARFFKDKDLEGTVRASFDRAVANTAFFEYSGDYTVDFSWLTGSAGVLWASKTMRNRPFINPLFPPDSLVWGE